MTDRNAIWVLLADAEHGRLLRCSRTEQGRCHVEQHDQLENDEPEHEYERTSPLRGRGGVTYGIEAKGGRERRQRFARRLILWLKRRTRQDGPSEIVFLAPPRFLGCLRKAARRHWAPHMLERPVDLATMSPGKIAEHPVIRELVGLSPDNDGTCVPLSADCDLRNGRERRPGLETSASGPMRRCDPLDETEDTDEQYQAEMR